ncbi:CBS domain-containing protein [Candidatus Woesearchaeota archaeon]|nr:CBS domain-containing protein [Candidatus Woesearchaeota archaeon]
MQVKDILRLNYLAVSPDDTLSFVFGKLGRGKHTEAVVLDNKGYYAGMVWKRALIRSRVDPAETKVRKFVGKPAALALDMTLERAAMLMHNSDFHVLPVLDKKVLLGIVGARDVLDELSGKLKGMKADEVGTMKLNVLTEDDSIGKAVSLFSDKRIDHAPVVDKAGKLVGVVSVVDLLTKYLISARGALSGRHGKHGRTSKSGQDPGERPSFELLPVGNIMERIVVTASPKTSASEIIRLIHDNGISAVVLVSDNEPVGIVTTKDLLYEVAR